MDNATQGQNFGFAEFYSALKRADAVATRPTSYVVEHPTLGLLHVKQQAPEGFPYPPGSFLVSAPTARRLRESIPQIAASNPFGSALLNNIYELGAEELYLRARQLCAQTLDVAS